MCWNRACSLGGLLSDISVQSAEDVYILHTNDGRSHIIYQET